MLIRPRTATIAGAPPERQRLAEAVGKADAAAAEVAAIRSAIETATDRIFILRDETEAARRALERARAAAIDHAVAEALGTAAAPPASVREARAREQAATDDLAAAEAARGALERRLPEAEAEAAFQRERARSRAREFAASSQEVAALVDRAEEIQREHARLCEALEFLSRIQALDTTRRPDGTRSRAELVALRARSAPADWIGPQDRPNGSAAWRGWLAALETDPAAPGPAP